ncbi:MULTISPECIES: oxygenase MpaB family protein [Actinomycetes]|uniref:oxygenase MpaB family protein n=1 Tax=Actinomycetes TaxID=1760 RepID=UPI0018F86AF3|nr:oxygenase MpaB family protein [Amycolatopsis sp. AA4]
MRTVAPLSIYACGETRHASRGRAVAETALIVHRNRRYNPLGPGAYAWVHAALAMTPVAAQRLLSHPMSTSELDEHHTQMQILGVRERDPPPTWPGIRAVLPGDNRQVPNETIRTLLETIDSVRNPFSHLSAGSGPKRTLKRTDVPDPHAGRAPSPRPASAAPPSSGGRPLSSLSALTDNPAHFGRVVHSDFDLWRVRAHRPRGRSAS